MVAISLLLFVFRARDHRGLDGDLQAEGDRRRTPQGGRGKSRGKKGRADRVAAQMIEAQPVFGQIEPSQRLRAPRAEPQVREKMAAFGSAPQEVETTRRRKRNEGRQKTISPAQGQSRTNGSSTGLCGPGHNQRLLTEVFR